MKPCRATAAAGAALAACLALAAWQADPLASAAVQRDPNPCVGPDAVNLLCPTLTISKPADMYFERRRGRLVLRATSSLNSVGAGPIELHGLRHGAYTMIAKQRIYKRAGGYITVRTGARLGFKSVPGQYRYWKLLNAASFELWSVDSNGRR
ncbi:MAG: hypothetical protein QOH74_244, partial [Gaiellales bacterium]|nr:hypothetical protein [Gaiellales bacterium]